MMQSESRFSWRAVRPRSTCEECGRVFDLLDKHDVSAYYYGHDCES
jgi:hypothetical protein